MGDSDLELDWDEMNASSDEASTVASQSTDDNIPTITAVAYEKFFYDTEKGVAHVWPELEIDHENNEWLRDMSDVVAMLEYRVPIPLQPTKPKKGVPSKVAFFMENYNECIAIPVPTDCNRETLRVRHKDLLLASGEPIDFQVLYKSAVPTGWAIPKTVESTILDALRLTYPSHRPLSKEDLEILVPNFCKQAAADTEAAANPCPLPPDGAVASQALTTKSAFSRCAVAAMDDTEKFLAVLKDAGGWEKAVFVAVDVEAAAVCADGVTLPVEVAFIPFSLEALPSEAEPPLERTAYHSFVQPGALPEDCEETAKYTSISVHGIPYEGGFLSTDYRQIREDIDCYVKCPSCILVSKGSPQHATPADLQALRYLYAAAICVDDDDTPIPSLDDFRMFNYATILRALGQEEEVKNQSWKPSDDETKKSHCWYHRDLPALVDKDDFPTFHCARSDAAHVADLLEKIIRQSVTGATR